VVISNLKIGTSYFFTPLSEICERKYTLLPKEATHKEFLLVQQEGKRQVHRKIAHYNLDVIIAIGYRVQSPVATRFRRWATARLHSTPESATSPENIRPRCIRRS
jgi:hypothetical protein